MKNSYNILIVEDEWMSAQFLKDILEERGIESVHTASNAKDAITIVKKEKIDFVFMDINIEGQIDGIQCATLINQIYYLPIIYITAYNDSNTLLEASDTNVYGYLSKPFDEKDIEIQLHVMNRLLKKRAPEEESNKIIIDDFYYFDKKNNLLFEGSSEISLTKKELQVLNIFIKNINKNVSYDYLKNEIWRKENISNSTIRDTISRIRKKAVNLQIENSSGLGYRLISKSSI